METILLIASIGIMNILCFFIGAKVGQKVVNKEEIKLPTVNPIKIVKEYEDKKTYSKEQEIMKINMDNIDNYDGSNIGQRDFPK